MNQASENFNIEQLLDDNILLQALDEGFHFEFNNLKHKDIVTFCIKSRNLEEILDKINNVNDIVFIIVNTGEPKLVLLRSLINNNLDKIKEILKNSYITKKHVNFIIDSCNLELLKSDKEILELAISKGYVFNEYTLEMLEEDKNLLIKKIDNITELDELLNLINSLSDEILKDNVIINLAITKGYYFNSFTPQVLKSNKEVVKRILASIHFKDNNSFYILETINNCDPNILDEQILDVAKNKLGYFVTVASPIERINEIYKERYDNYLKTFDSKHQDNFRRLGQKIGYGLIYYERNNSVFKKEVIDAFGINAVSKIYKYYILLGNSIDFDYLIKNDGLEKFKYLFAVLSDNNDNFKTFDMKLFIEFLKKYEIYGNLCFVFISSNGINDESKKTLKILLTHKYKNIEIKDVNDLKNINLIIKENNDKIIANSHQLEIKNIICLLLCNMTLDEINKMFYSIDKNSLTKLKNEINEDRIKLILERYIILIEFLNYVKNCNDLEKLRIIASKINSFDYDKQEKLRQNFVGIFENIKYFYGLEVNSKLTKLSSLKPSEKTIISIDQYKASNGNCVKYIDSYENCILFQHVMNAYGRGGRIYDFKNSRLVGQTRLCLSLSSNNQDGVKREPIDIDHVTLVFDNIDPSSLIVMDYRDISSNASINSLIIFHNVYSCFDTTYDIIEKTKNTGYNEYNVYIENNDGSYIYPSGVKVTGDIPNQSEIEAAEYLGVPLIKIHKTKKLGIDRLEVQKIIPSELELTQLNELKEVFSDLKQKQMSKINF